MKPLGLLGVMVLATLCMGASPLKYTGKPYWTYPMAGKIPPNNPLKVVPASQVPENPESYIWKVVVSKNSPGASGVPIYAFDHVSRRTKVGFLPVGTIIKLEKFRTLAKTHYYSVSWQGKMAWINGHDIAPSARAPSGQ